MGGTVGAGRLVEASPAGASATAGGNTPTGTCVVSTVEPADETAVPHDASANSTGATMSVRIFTMITPATAR